MLAGRTDVLRYTREGLKAHMRTLVAAGILTTEADARRACLLQLSLFVAHKLDWYLARRAAVLEFGGSAEDVLTACGQSYSLHVLLKCLLLFKRAECAANMSYAKGQRVALKASASLQAAAAAEHTSAYGHVYSSCAMCFAPMRAPCSVFYCNPDLLT